MSLRQIEIRYIHCVCKFWLFSVQNMSVERKNALKNQKFLLYAWLEDPCFVGRLTKVKNDKSKARFILCHKSTELWTSGQYVLTDHAKGKNMLMLLLKGKSYLNLNLLKPSPTLTLLLIISELWKKPTKNDSSKAEIIWLLKCVMSGCFLRLNGDLGDTLCAMNSGVGSVKNFSMTRSKSMYSVNLGCTLCVCTNGFAQMYSIRLSSRHYFKQSQKSQRYFHTVLMRVLTKLPKHLKSTCLSNFGMVLTNVSKWCIIVLRFLDMADTLTYWITMLKWQKASNLNISAKSQWMTLLWIWSFSRVFCQNWRMRIIIHLLILVVALHIVQWFLGQNIKIF